MSKPKYFWIKERHNPQTGVYYVAKGRMPISAARKYEKTLYGTNYMLKFDNEEEYNNTLDSLLLS